MTATEYREVLKDTLKIHTQSAVDMIFKIKTNFPEKAKSVDVGIHSNQDQDRMFSVMVHLCGTDLYALNKAIADYRLLFDIKFIGGKLQPNTPILDPDEVSFSINDLIVEVGIDWINTLWDLSGGLKIPGYVFGDECFSRDLIQFSK
ncbi:DUF6389 family protein [Cedecea sp. P7760]|uniref:DUF6389 family protein n=1 Tax=Cedecea sp. P7760 TaxID=2726983 RepID=UPI0015A47E4F|nr:DUF6389 family protein [Cedecea sp. P7760]NWC63320.1 hypothetical protein [Cedecea sp. P7760]